MASTIAIASAFLALFLISTTTAHSQMRCAKFDIATGNCYAAIRNEGVAFEEEDNDMTTGGGVCQSPMSNPISASYSNGSGCPDYAPCPDPMGTFAQGETFTIMWLARNHAVADQTPGNILLFLGPVTTQTQGTDFSAAVLGQQQICEAPFMSCNGSNGNFVQCWASCTMPVNAAVGIHTLWWEWIWTETSSFNVYTTCADIYVTASGSAAPTPVPQSSSHASVSTSSSTSGAKVPVTSTSSSSSSHAASTSTTGKVAPMTTGAKAPVTSTSTSTSSHAASTSTTGKVAPMTTGAKAPVTSTSTSTSTSTTGSQVPVTSTSSSSSSSTTCTLGQQRCSGQSSYQTCEYVTRDSLGWATAQSCNTGLSCHPSATANNIYCY